MSIQPGPQVIQAAELLKSAVPAGWSTFRLKYLLAAPITDGPHTTPEFLSDGVPFLSVDGIQDGELVFEGCRFVSEADHLEYRRKASPRRGDILIGKAASTGKIARVKTEVEFSIWSPLALIRPNQRVVHSSFLEYGLKSPMLQSQIDDLCTSNTQKNISMADLPRLVLPLPELPQQLKIVQYLDRETTQIARLIAEKEGMLALLDEKRAALISQAVTRGLDPSVRLRASEQEWLGQVPEHWQIERAKNLFFVRDERSEAGTEELLTVSHITGVTRRADKDVNMFEADDKAGYKRCLPGDLAINTLWAWMGAMGISPLEGIVSPDYHVYTSRGQLLPEYIDLLCRSRPFVAEVNRWSKGVWSSRLRLYPENFFEMRLPVPPHDEQRAIVKAVDADQRKANDLRSSLRQSIDLAKERRSALISAAVTGQIPLEEIAA